MRKLLRDRMPFRYLFFSGELLPRTTLPVARSGATGGRSVLSAAIIYSISATGCTNAPNGQSLEGLKAEAAGKYEVIYTDALPRGTLGRTVKLDTNGPALVYIASDMNSVSRDGALTHELYYHVLRDDSHPVRPPKSNIAVPDRGRFWDRLKYGAPE